MDLSPPTRSGPGTAVESPNHAGTEHWIFLANRNPFEVLGAEISTCIGPPSHCTSRLLPRINAKVQPGVLFHSLCNNLVRFRRWYQRYLIQGFYFCFCRGVWRSSACTEVFLRAPAPVSNRDFGASGPLDREAHQVIA